MKSSILERTYTKCIVSNNPGILVEESTKQTISDMKYLKEKGFYVYGVRHDSKGTPDTVESGPVYIDHFGYMVFKKPIIFPKKNIIYNTTFYSLKCRYAKIGIGGWITKGDILTVIKTI